LLALPSSALITFDTRCDICILVDLISELGVVLDGRANEPGWDSEVAGCLIHIPVTRSHRRHDLVHVEAGAHHQRLSPTRRTFVEPDQRMTLEPYRLAEKSIGQCVP
jgi:hypothetical protein